MLLCILVEDYITNIDEFFQIYNDSRFVIPVRDVLGYIASEKIRLARIFLEQEDSINLHCPHYL